MTNEKYLKDLAGIDGVKYYDVKSAVEDIKSLPNLPLPCSVGY